MNKKFAAEVLGTFWLVFGGCGAALFAGKGIGLHGISMAFGLTVMTMAFTVGHISGGHFNPAVTIGLVMARRHPASEAGAYIGAQLVGAIAAAGALALIVQTGEGSHELGQFAANAWGEAQGNKVTMVGAFITEALTTFIFLMVIIGSTSKRAPAGFAPIAIGLCLALIHLVTIPLTNTSVNPARSISQGIFAGDAYIKQLWLFIVAPIVGAVLAGATSRWLQAEDQ